MSEYRKTVKIRLIILIVCAVISLAIVMLGFNLASQAETPASTYTDGFAKGLPIGLFSAFCALILFNIIKCIRALAGDTLLKKMYVDENDERKKMIRQSALVAGFIFTVGALVVGITVASFFSNIVTITLMAVLGVYALSGAFFKLYYFKKY